MTGAERSTDAVGSEDGLRAFRSHVQHWLAENFEKRGPDAGMTGSSDSQSTSIARARAYQRALYDAGFAGITWPSEFGGGGFGIQEQLAFNEEAARYLVPDHDVYQHLTVGLGMCGPTILSFGSHEQRARFIRPLLRADEVWCQLFSEPGAGSDLAAIRTTARRVRDSWRIDGQKVWTSCAHFADYGLALVRTDLDAPPRRGMSVFIVPLLADGVVVRPIRNIAGEAEFNEVFFDGVMVPSESIVGDRDGGWRVAMGTLASERLTLGTAVATPTSSIGQELVDLLRSTGRNRDPRARQAVARVWSLDRVLSLLSERISANLTVGGDPGPLGSIGKVLRSRLAKDAGNLRVSLLGMASTAWVEGEESAPTAAVRELCNAVATSIGGGTDEVQRTALAERILELPRYAGSREGSAKRAESG